MDQNKFTALFSKEEIPPEERAAMLAAQREKYDKIVALLLGMPLSSAIKLLRSVEDDLYARAVVPQESSQQESGN